MTHTTGRREITSRRATPKAKGKNRILLLKKKSVSLTKLQHGNMPACYKSSSKLSVFPCLSVCLAESRLWRRPTLLGLGLTLGSHFVQLSSEQKIAGGAVDLSHWIGQRVCVQEKVIKIPCCLGCHLQPWWETMFMVMIFSNTHPPFTLFPGNQFEIPSVLEG